MRFEWLWQSLFARLVWTAIALAGATALAWLKERGYFPWTDTIRYGLGVFLLIIFSMVGLKLFLAPVPKPPEQTKPGNVEARVRDWLDDFGVGVQKQTDASVFFEFLITLRNHNPVLIARTRARDRYLTLQGTINVSPEHAAIIARLSPAQLVRMYDEITVEMARARVGFQVVSVPESMRVQAVVISKGVPITGGLTEDSLASDIDQIDSGMVLAREAIRLALVNTHAPGTVLLQ